MIAGSLAASWREVAGDALANLHDRGRRSVLALIGIVIGTASVVAMLSIGHMAAIEATRLFSRMGVDKILIRATTGVGLPGLDRTVVETAPRRVSGLVAAAPLMTGQLPTTRGNIPQFVAVVALPPAVQQLAGLQLARGRFIVPVDDDNLVAIVGAKAAATLSRSGPPLDLGQEVRIGRYLFTVVGLLRPGPSTAFDPADFNNALIIPLGSARRALGAVSLNAGLAQVAAGQDAMAVAVELVADLRRALPGSRIEVNSARQLIEAMRAQQAVHARLLAAIGGISLLVGGIGIMNVMLMNVMERRREIGLRAAIGATPWDIQLMFLVEAAVLALAGGVAGVAVGIAASDIAARVSGWAFSIALYTIPLGSGVATLVGVVFGLYPAVTASRLDPIEALRAE